MIKIYSRPHQTLFCLTLMVLLLALSPSLHASGNHRGKKKALAGKAAKEAMAKSWLKNQPVEFLENKGQLMDINNQPVPFVLFKAEAPGMDLYVTAKGLSYVFLKVEEEGEEEEKEARMGKEQGRDEKVKVTYERIDMELAGASIQAKNILKEDTGLAYFNYMMGPGQTISHVKKYRKITVRDVYPGIDWVLYNSSGTGFKYDFIVHPGADASRIEMVYKTKRDLAIAASGEIQVKAFNGTLHENAPYSYLLESGRKTESSFKLLSRQKKNGLIESRIGFTIAARDASGEASTLVIDPQLEWATFYGGNNLDGTTALDTDTLGNIYTVGYGGSTNFPLLSAGTYFQPIPATAFIIKFSDSGVLLWSTFYASTGTSALYIKVDNSGNAFICGASTSTNFPLVNNSTYFQATNAGVNDAYITKFDNAGNCLWATLYGGNNQDQGSALATDASGNVFMVGTTASTNFPVQNASTYFDPAISGGGSCFLAKFDNNGNRSWSTYLNGLGVPGISADLNGNVYVVGISTTGTTIPLFNPGGLSYYQPAAVAQDGVILKFSNSGVLRWGTYYGGSSQDYINNVVADKRGNTFMLGSTQSPNLPIQNAGTYFQAALAGLNEVFFLKFDSTGVRSWGTYFGGSRAEILVNSDCLALDTCGNLYAGFYTRSHNIPLMAACEGGFNDTFLDTSVMITNSDIYTARFSNNGALQWGTYLGGDGLDFRTALTVNRYGNYFITGEWVSPTSASSYPLINPGGSTYFSAPFQSDDIYIAKFSAPVTPPQSFSYTAAYCVSDTNHLPVKAAGFLTGGTFTASSGLGINPLTGQVTPSTSAPGTYTVNYLLAPCHCPNVQPQVKGTATVTILSAPVLTVSGNYTICTGKLATFIASGANSYSWNIGSQSPTITLTAPTVTTVLNYTVTGNTNGGSCTAKKTFSVLVSRCTGVEELSINGTLLSIYPNPSQGEFTISGSADAAFELVNTLGQVVRHIELTAANDRKAVVRGLAAGSYFLKDKSGRVSEQHKIIVNE